MSETFREQLVKTLTEQVFKEDDFNPEGTYPYVDKVAKFLEIDARDMYNFIGNSLAYQSVEELDIAKDNSDIEEKEYEIHKKFFDKFGKDEFALTDEDLNQIGSSRDEFEQVHNDLV